MIRLCVAACSTCALCAERTQTVFGVGDPVARVMFVGEAPGVQEDRRGEDPAAGLRVERHAAGNTEDECEHGGGSPSDGVRHASPKQESEASDAGEDVPYFKQYVRFEYPDGNCSTQARAPSGSISDQRPTTLLMVRVCNSPAGRLAT